MKRKMRKSRRLPKGCDSFLEADLKEGGLQGCEWKPERIDYIVRKKYSPDCSFGNIIIEVKGRFRTSGEASKYLWVRKHLLPDQELVFVFANPNLKMPNARRRKDETYRTHADWADHHGFCYYDLTHLPREWGRK